jgi:AcrR family transcriptional regulator
VETRNLRRAAIARVGGITNVICDNIRYLTPSNSRLSIRDEQRALTRTRLLDSAKRVFARRGFHAASVEEIAREAGATTGAIYSNFAGKEDLFLALFEEHVASQVAKYRELFARGADLQERSRGGADDWMAYLRKEPDSFPLLIEFWSYAIRDPELRPRYAARLAAFRETFAQLIEEGARDLGLELPPGFAVRMGTVLNALGNGLALEKLADPEAVPDELLGSTIALMFQTLVAAARAGDVELPAGLSEGAS